MMSSKSERSRAQEALAGRRILVVDDDPDELAFIATVLEDNGAVIIRATGGDEALQFARKEKPDLMTLDLGMPGKSGVDVYIEMREDPELEKLPVCIITGRPEMRKLIYERASTPPPEGYMNKPVDERSLLLNIRKILEVGVR
ncbi:MAG: response regulator [Planctomycetota bacterium]|jgi:CheY-like chemotaxis protein